MAEEQKTAEERVDEAKFRDIDARAQAFAARVAALVTQDIADVSEELRMDVVAGVLAGLSIATADVIVKRCLVDNPDKPGNKVLLISNTQGLTKSVLMATRGEVIRASMETLKRDDVDPGVSFSAMDVLEKLFGQREGSSS